MRGTPSSFAIKAVLAALFLWVQGAALFDAAAHGEQQHEHYGITCDLTKAVATKVAPLPACDMLPAPPATVEITAPVILDFQPWSRPPGRAPPPRSPPAFHQ
ncbi:MAG: hypothetical protein RLN72_05095 [Henriciella sp.]